MSGNSLGTHYRAGGVGSAIRRTQETRQRKKPIKNGVHI